MELAEVFGGSTQLVVGYANANLVDKYLEVYDYRDVTILSLIHICGRSLHYSVSPGNGSLAKKAMPQAPGPAWVPITGPMACTIGFCRCRFCVT